MCFIRRKHGWIDGDETTVLEGYNEKEKLKQIALFFFFFFFFIGKQIALFDHQILGREMFLSYDKTHCVLFVN